MSSQSNETVKEIEDVNEEPDELMSSTEIEDETTTERDELEASGSIPHLRCRICFNLYNEEQGDNKDDVCSNCLRRVTEDVLGDDERAASLPPPEKLPSGPPPLTPISALNVQRRSRLSSGGRLKKRKLWSRDEDEDNHDDDDDDGDDDDDDGENSCSSPQLRASGTIPTEVGMPSLKPIPKSPQNDDDNQEQQEQELEENSEEADQEPEEKMLESLQNHVDNQEQDENKESENAVPSKFESEITAEAEEQSNQDLPSSFLPSVDQDNNSILRHVTSWLPQHTRLHDVSDGSDRGENEIMFANANKGGMSNEVANKEAIASRTARGGPQRVEYLAGRKFLIIPRCNVVSVSSSFPSTRSRPKPDNLVTSESATVNNVGNTNTTTGRKRNSVVNSNTTNRRLSSENQSTTSTITSHQQKNKESRLKNNHNEGDTNENANFLQLVSFGYDSLLYIFQYLKVQDLLRAGRVCSMWRDLASHPRLWRTVRMKNSHVRSFEGMAEALRKHSTVQLDLRKMLLTTNSSNNNNNNGGGGGGAGVTAASNTDEMWPEFSSNIGKVETLRKIELCRCPSSVIENLALTNPHLEIVNAVMIRSDQIDLANLSNWTGLRELRLKATPFFSLGSTGIDPLRGLRHLRHLSLTSIRDLNRTDLTVIAELTELESLDLGECVDFPAHFGPVVLSKLKKLEKLRIEKGQGDCHPFDMLRAVQKMEKLEQLELVNFDVKPGFDKALGACKNLKKLLMIPTYISQSATTSHMVLAGVLRLRRSLTHFVWGVTLELLRVTELFVDQCDDEEKKDKKQIIGMGDSIPVLKPVPLLTTSSEEWKNKAVEEMEREEEELPAAFDPPQVEILALPGLQKLLLQCLPDTRVKILKIPFHATWRQSINDAVN